MTNDEICRKIDHIMGLMTDDVSDECFDDLIWQQKSLVRMVQYSNLTELQVHRVQDVRDYYIKVKNPTAVKVLTLVSEKWLENLQEPVSFPYTHLSSITGIHVTNISRCVSRLAKEGVLSVSGRGQGRKIGFEEEFLDSIKFDR